MANLSRIGFGQVEPNHLSGIVTGQILAQLPADSSLGQVLENGRFAKYDYKNGKVNLTGAGEWMMIYNEEKLYDERKQSHKDFAMVKSNYTDGEMVPRLISILIGDIYTTNCIGKANDSADATVDTGVDTSDLEYLKVNTDGYLVKADDASGDAPIFQVVKDYTMPDGQQGLKLMRIK